jgi:hypothetical protein
MLATIGHGYHQFEVAVEVAVAKHAPFTLAVSVAFLSDPVPRFLLPVMRWIRRWYDSATAYV